MTQNFDALKLRTLSGSDKSPKGSWDAPLIPLLDLVNAHPDYVSTSSCSGRISVYLAHTSDPLEDEERAQGPKGHGTWAFVSHDCVPVTNDPVSLLFSSCSDSFQVEKYNENPSLLDSKELVHLRFEPVVIHITARDLPCAQKLLSICIQAGFRNSGLGVTNSRVNIAIRPTPRGLDVPVARLFSPSKLQLIVSDTYLSMLLQLANSQCARNIADITSLFKAVQTGLSAKNEPESWEPKELRKERKRLEGLERQKLLRKTNPPSTSQNVEDADV